MANELIKAGIVLTGDARSAVDAFKQLKVAQDELREKMAASQAEVNRLARALEQYSHLGVNPSGVREEFEQAKAAAQALRAQVDANSVALERGRQALRQYGVSTVNLNADMKALAARQAEAARAAEDLAGQVKKVRPAGEDAMSTLLGIGRQVSGLFGVGIGVGLVRAIVQQADAYQQVEQRLKLVVKGTGDLDQVERQLFESAQRTRSSYVDVAEVYARIARSASQTGRSQGELLKINEAVNQSITISGVSAESARGALIQFGQALASNRLSGDELRSVLEQAPRLAQAIADGLGVSIGELRKLGEEGKLTSDKVLGALLSQVPKLNEEFKQMKVTVTGSLEQAKNSAGKLIDTLNGGGEGTGRIAQAFSAWSRAVDTVSDKIARLRAEQDRLALPTLIADLETAAAALNKAGFTDAANRALKERAELQERYSRAIVATSLSADDLARNQRELDRTSRLAAPPVKPSEDFLEIQARLSGVNKEFVRDLNILNEAYRSGVLGITDSGAALEKYRALVAKLVETETEAGRNAKRVADERLRVSRQLAEQSVRDQQAIADAVRKSFEQNLADAKKFADEASKLRELSRAKSVALQGESSIARAEGIASADVKALEKKQAEELKQAKARGASDNDLSALKDRQREALDAQKASSEAFADIKRQQDAQELIDKAGFRASDAVFSAGQGRIEKAKEFAAAAKKLAEEAEQAAKGVKDGFKKATLLDDVDRAQKNAAEAAAKIAEKQGADAAKVAEDQRAILGELEARATALKAALAKVPLTLDTEAAKAAFAALQEEFGKGFTVPLRTQATDPTASAPTVAAVPAFAGGGAIEGPGPRGVDSLLAMLAPGEHVLTAREVAAAGGHGAIYALRAAMLAQRVPRFAEGGAVGRMGAAPRTEAAGMVPARFVFPGVGEVSALVERRDADGLGKQLRRVATARGARR